MDYLSTYKEKNYISTILPSSNYNKSSTNITQKSIENLNPIVLIVTVSDGLGGITNLSYPLVIQ